MLETCKVAQYPFQAGQQVQHADWELYIRVRAAEWGAGGVVVAVWLGLLGMQCQLSQAQQLR